jgi:tetratricopeptide (TPR) repeat protein
MNHQGNEGIMEAVYSEFLATAELTVWQKCLDKYNKLVQTPGTSDRISLGLLAQGLCIAQYTQWFAALAGDEEARERAQMTFEQLATAAGSRNLGGSNEGALVNSLIAAGRGYRAAARNMLEETGQEVPVEVILLMTPNAPAKVARDLGERIYQDTVEHSFLPAVHIYAEALLKLGYLQQVQDLLDRRVADSSNPLIVDLQGMLYELTGAWPQAQACYDGSKKWVIHKYRAAICSVIVQVSAGQDVAHQWSETDESLQKAMLLGDSESDQADVARTGSFVNVCRWYNFDNWLVHYELGSLSFRRRRHTEAEKHLSIAARQAPASVAFAVNHLRFVNLTWLRGTSMGRSLPVLPETLECAYAALQASGPEKWKASIRTWLAEATRDPTVLSPVYRSSDLFAKGEAHELEGNAPESLQCFSRALAEENVPRAFHHMIETLARCGFEETTCYLIDISMEESWDDFFQLWELGKSLLGIIKDRDRYFTLQHIGARFARIEERLEQLAEAEFQHLMRAWSFYASYGRGDFAARVLQRATQLAESPEEYLLLAVARRDRTGLLGLLRAEEESSHRLERLEIAKELAQRGQITRARRILRDEGVFESSEVLSPLEYVLVLECGSPCLSKDETKVLSERAAANLERDRRADLFGPYANKFMERLSDHTDIPSQYVHDWLVDTEGSAEPGDSVWQSWQASLEKLEDPALLERQRVLVERQMSESGKDEEVLFFYLAVWGPMFRNLDALLGSIWSIRPTREPAETPISRTDSIAINLRAKAVSRLWRGYLSNRDTEQAERLLYQVSAFYREEERLKNEWETLRRREMQGPLERVRYFVETGLSVLDRIGRCAERADVWPPFLHIREHMRRDVNTLQKRLASQLGSAGTELQQGGLAP